MSRTHKLVLAAATLTTAAVLVSPAGAATTSWTKHRLTSTVRSLVGYVNADKKRDSHQAWRITGVAKTNFVQSGKLHTLRLFVVNHRGRLTALEAQDAVQAQLNAGIVADMKLLPKHTPGCWYGGWSMRLIGEDVYNVCNGRDGRNGHHGHNGHDGLPGLSAYQVWLAEGNEGTTADFLAAITGAPGAKGATGATGAIGATGAAGLSAYEVWLAAGNTGTIADFLQSIAGPQGAKGDPGQSAYQAWLAVGNTGSLADFAASLVGPQGQKGETGAKGATGATGPQGPKGDKGDPGTLNAQKLLVCTTGNGNNRHLATGSACQCEPDAIWVYVPTS
jgi:hypothetical protein